MIALIHAYLYTKHRDTNRSIPAASNLCFFFRKPVLPIDMDMRKKTAEGSYEDASDQHGPVDGELP